MIQHHSDHGASNKADESSLRVESSVPLMYHDPNDNGSLTDPDPDNPKGLHRKL